MRKQFAFISFLFLCVSLVAQNRIVQIQGEYVYHAPQNISLADAKAEALKRAKIEALANTFGTVVSQNTMNVISSVRGESFYAEGETLVRGEWIQTLGQPVFEQGFFEEGFWVKCYVKGVARELNMSQVELDVHVFANGLAHEFESSMIKSGSHVYMSVKSPVKGYLSVFIYDPVNDVMSCLFPYKGAEHMPYHMPANREVVLFNKENDTTGMHVRQITLSCEEDLEVNTLYVIFSSNDYPLPFMEENNDKVSIPETLTFSQFNKWKSKRMTIDSRFQVLQESITIVK